MTAMLHDLVGTIADEIRAALPADRRSRTPSRPDARVAAVGGRTARPPDSSRCCCAAPTSSGSPPPSPAAPAPRKLPLLPSLVGDDDARISAAAMALILARGRRRDRFGQPRIEFDDLPADEAAMPGPFGRGGASDAVPASADGARGRRARQLSLPATRRAELASKRPSPPWSRRSTGRAARRAIARGAAEEGEVALLAAPARAPRRDRSRDRLGLSGRRPGRGRSLLLMRMAGASRPIAARLLAEFGDLARAAIRGRRSPASTASR